MTVLLESLTRWLILFIENLDHSFFFTLEILFVYQHIVDVVMTSFPVLYLFDKLLYNWFYMFVTFRWCLLLQACYTLDSH